MKKHLLKRLALTLVLSASGLVASGQIVGSDAFMQGDVVEIGVNTCGAYASNSAPPAGYVVTGLTGLNFICDVDGDGWDVGEAEYCGDYAVPGSPVEGWGIEISGISYFNTDRTCGISDVDGEITSYAAEGDSVVVIWEGSVAGVDIQQRSVLYTNQYYFLTWITLTNTTGSALSDIYYKRNIDPDNEQLLTGSFVTINTVESSPFAGDLDAVVTAVGETYGCYLGIVARNPNARVSHGNFSTNTGTVSDTYDGIGGYNLSGTATADQAIQISFIVPSLAAGASETFAFAHVFREIDLEDALVDTYVGGYDDCAGTPEVGGAFASATTTCASDVFSVSVDVESAVGISYQWQSSLDGVTYSDIVGATGSSYSTSIVDPTYFQCLVSCSASGESTLSDAVFVDNVCPGCTDPTALNYFDEANEDDGSCFYGYTISECSYVDSYIPGPGTEICLGDDAVSAALPIGFTFSFYGECYDNVYIGSNGYLNFSGTTLSACCSGQILPNASYPASIFFAQEDLDPNSCTDGTISYWTIGDPGNRTFIADFTDVPHYPGPEGTFPVSTQVQLFEATGEIKIVTTEMNSDGGNHTMGLNLDGTIAQPVDGRNSTNWSAFEECISFMPSTEPACGPSCPAPSTPTLDVLTATTATLSWDPVDGASKYVLAIRNNTTGVRETRQFNVTEITFPSLTPGHSYTFRVKAVCFPDGISEPSTAVDFTTPLRSGLFQEGVQIYPNPSDGNFRVQVDGCDCSTVDLMVYNTLGKVVYADIIPVDQGSIVYNVNLSKMAPGTYTLRLVGGADITTHQIVVE